MRTGGQRDWKINPTPAKTTRTGPLEFKDKETGEVFDVIQDDDLAPDPGEEPGAERGVEDGGRRGTVARGGGVRPPRSWT